LNEIAEKIELTGWTKYRGDMGTQGDDAKESYYTEWEGIEVMFHVAPWMNEEQLRRLVGNDIGVILFYDYPHPEFQ